MPAPIIGALASKAAISTAKRYLPRVIATLLPVLLLLVGGSVLMVTTILTSINASTMDTSQPISECAAGPGTITAGDWPVDQVVGKPTAEQLANVASIIKAGRDLGVSDYGQVIALAVSAQESGWRNLKHGDSAGPDSTGLFQQRDPWGPRADREDPYKSATLFYRQLLLLNGWETMTIGRAGQSVQRSAQASGQWYQDHEPIARAAFVQVGGSAGAGMCAGNGSAMECSPSQWPGVEAGLTPDGVRVLRCGSAHQPAITSVGGVGDRPSTVDDDHQTGKAVDFMIPAWSMPAGVAMGDDLAGWFRANAGALGVKYVIWNAKIWSVARDAEGWRPYQNPNGGGPTLQHRDHVHVSVYGNSAGAGAAASGDVVLPLSTYVLTARFGDAGSRWSSGAHTGLDFAAPVGTPIMAPAAGTVVVAGWGGAYGNWTCIDVGSDTQLCFAHQASQKVAVGDRVVVGLQIGTVGTTGNVTGAHLHFEVRVHGKPIDPMPWLTQRGAKP